MSEFEYSDRMTFAETVNFHLRAMTKELATDGMDDQFEDMVDFFGVLIWADFNENERGKWNDLSEYEIGLEKAIDYKKWSIAKRFRCLERIKLGMLMLDREEILRKRTRTDSFSGQYPDLPVDVTHE